MSTDVTVHLVRHGQSRWNAEGRLQGQTADVALTAVGLRQADQAARTLTSSGATRVISSDLRRALETARPVAEVLGVQVELEPALREQALGVFEGRLSRDAWREPDADRWADPTWRPPGGESAHDVFLRLQGFVTRLMVEAPTSPLVLVSHGDTIRVALAVLRGAPATSIPWVAVSNGEIVTVRAHVGESGAHP